MTRSLFPAARQDGFTLVELIAVLAILAFAAAFNAPRMMTSRETLRLKSAAVSLASDLRATRAAARKTNTDAVFVLDLKRRSYQASGAVRPRLLPANVAISFEALAPSLRTASDIAAFRFRPDGTADGGRIVLKSATAQGSIAIDWLTGAVSLSWR